jgi:hypothetical protein
MYDNLYMYGYLSIVGWAKALLRRAHHFQSDARPNGGHATGRVRVRCLCPPYELVQRGSNLTAAWQIRGNFSANPWQPRSLAPPRIHREKARGLPQEKLHQHFAASLPQDSHMQLMFGAARFDDPALSASCSFGFRGRQRGDHAPRCLACCASASINTEF